MKKFIKSIVATFAIVALVVTLASDPTILKPMTDPPNCYKVTTNFLA